VLRRFDGKLLLRPEAQPVLIDDFGAITLGQGRRVVGAARVDDDNFIGKMRTLQASLQLRRGVKRDDDNRKRLARGGHL
jgi:hypothetical protein